MGGLTEVRKGLVGVGAGPPVPRAWPTLSTPHPGHTASPSRSPNTLRECLDVFGGPWSNSQAIKPDPLYKTRAAPKPGGGREAPPTLHLPEPGPQRPGYPSFLLNVYSLLCSMSSGGPWPPGGLLEPLPRRHIHVHPQPCCHLAGAGRVGHTWLRETPLGGDRSVCLLTRRSCKTGGAEMALPRSPSPPAAHPRLPQSSPGKTGAACQPG